MSEFADVRIVPAKVRLLDHPPIRSAKEWRRYQVMLKRLQEHIDKRLMESLFGPPSPPRPTPPRRGPLIRTDVF